jgi:hypothetical protein
MQERMRQIDIKRSKVLHEEKMDNMWLQIERENLEQQYKKEEMEVRVRKVKSEETRATQQQQVQ